MPSHTRCPRVLLPCPAAATSASVMTCSPLEPIQGPIPFDHDVAGAHARVNALAESVLSDLKDEIPQIINEYNAVIDAYASNNFDPRAVLAHASDGVRATLERLAREAQGDEGLEPEAALLYQASHICSPDDTESWYSRQGVPIN